MARGTSPKRAKARMPAKMNCPRLSIDTTWGGKRIIAQFMIEWPMIVGPSARPSGHGDVGPAYPGDGLIPAARATDRQNIPPMEYRGTR